MEREDVMKKFDGRPDENNNWRPFHGFVFRDLFMNSDNPFWA
jgi:hypothetical protein